MSLSLKVTLISVLLISTASSATPYSLSGVMQSGAEVDMFEVSPNSRDVVFIADRTFDNLDEVYSVPTKEGGPITLLFSPAPWEVVERFHITSDSRWVIVLVDNTNDQKTVLYRVAIRGGPVIDISNDGPNWGDAIDSRLSANSQYLVLYTSKTIGQNTSFRLYSVPLDSGVITQLNGPPATEGNLKTFAISPNSQTVVFTTAGEINATSRELYTTPITGGTSNKISAPLASGERVGSFKISPDGQRVVFNMGTGVVPDFDLYSVPIIGGSVTQISGPIVVGGSTNSEFEITPNSQTVIFPADKETDGIDELFSVPIAGGQVNKISGSLVNGGEVDTTYFKISNNNQRVVFRSDREVDEIFALYSVNVDGSDLTRISGGLGLLGDVTALYAISANSQHVVYMADTDTQGVVELYRTPIDGPPLLQSPTKLNGPLVSMGDVGGFEISPRSDSVIFRADGLVNNLVELFSVPVTGGAVETISPPLLLVNGDVLQMLHSPNGQYAVFTISEGVTGKRTLFAYQLFEDEDFCVPIKTQNNAVAVVCL